MNSGRATGIHGFAGFNMFMRVRRNISKLVRVSSLS